MNSTAYHVLGVTMCIWGTTCNQLRDLTTFHVRLAITGDDARLDVAARGICSPMVHCQQHGTSRGQVRGGTLRAEQDAPSTGTAFSKPTSAYLSVWNTDRPEQWTPSYRCGKCTMVHWCIPQLHVNEILPPLTSWNQSWGTILVCRSTKVSIHEILPLLRYQGCTAVERIAERSQHSWGPWLFQGHAGTMAGAIPGLSAGKGIYVSFNGNSIMDWVIVRSKGGCF